MNTTSNQIEYGKLCIGNSPFPRLITEIREILFYSEAEMLAAEKAEENYCWSLYRGWDY